MMSKKMNKYQKALNTIIDAIRDYVSYREFDLLPSENEIFGAMALLRKLVNKEIPKKPIDVEIGPCGDSMLSCPNCGQLLERDDEDDC